MNCIIIVSSWPKYKSKWTQSSKNCSFAKNNKIANQLPDTFTDTQKITKSHIPAENTPSQIDIPEGQHDNTSKACLKYGSHAGLKGKNPQKKKSTRRIKFQKVIFKRK